MHFFLIFVPMEKYRSKSNNPNYQPRKSKRWEVLGLRVPPGEQAYWKAVVYRLIYEDQQDDLYLLIKENPDLTVQEIAYEFGMKPDTVRNFAKKLNLPLSDFPAIPDDILKKGPRQE